MSDAAGRTFAGDPASPEGPAPVVTIDGPAASGKGTIAAAVARRLGLHYLDSGSLYRLVALVAIESGTRFDDEPSLARIAAGLAVDFAASGPLLAGRPVADSIRTEAVSNGASLIAVHPAVRTALLDRQRAFARPPGLVADGRDMGTVVFPRAAVKVFVTASAEARAERRHKQLMGKGISASLDSLLRDIQERDQRDSGRKSSPLLPASDAIVLDTTAISADQAIGFVIGLCARRGIGTPLVSAAAIATPEAAAPGGAVGHQRQ